MAVSLGDRGVTRGKKEEQRVRSVEHGQGQKRRQEGKVVIGRDSRQGGDYRVAVFVGGSLKEGGL